MTVETLDIPRRPRGPANRTTGWSPGALGPALPYLAPLVILVVTVYVAWAVRAQQRRQVAPEVAVAEAGVEADIPTEQVWLPAGILGAGLLLAGGFAATARFGRVARRHAAELERARRELERSNAELEQFAYVASHDLQEPLRQVAGFVRLLERKHGERLDAEAREYIDFAVEGVQRMQRLINDLLTYSRVGARTSEPEPVDPAEPLARALVDLQQAVEESRAVITHEGPMPRVMVDPRQLALVFQNLLSNAVKYAGDAPPRVHVSACRRGSEVEIAVSDRGIGIDPRFFDRIFVVFQRLHTREQFSGTGIGLAIVKRIVEQHGGRIWANSSPGDGATFHFTLPAAGEDGP